MKGTTGCVHSRVAASSDAHDALPASFCAQRVARVVHAPLLRCCLRCRSPASAPAAALRTRLLQRTYHLHAIEQNNNNSGDDDPGSPGASGDAGGGTVTLLAPVAGAAKAISAAPAVDAAGLALVDNRAVPAASTRMLLRESIYGGGEVAWLGSWAAWAAFRTI